MKIYTRRGDDGTTGMFGGPRVSKDDVRIEAYGTVDELGAALGLVRVAGLPSDLDLVVETLQHWLFDLGAGLASADPARSGLSAVDDRQVGQLEAWIDQFSAELPPLSAFILAGGSAASASLHWARAVCRRAERRVWTMSKTFPVPSPALPFLNRLSDLLFVLSRVANARVGQPDVLWQKSPPGP